MLIFLCICMQNVLELIESFGFRLWNFDALVNVLSLVEMNLFVYWIFECVYVFRYVCMCMNFNSYVYLFVRMHNCISKLKYMLICICLWRFLFFCKICVLCKAWIWISSFKGIFEYAILCPWRCEHFDIAHLPLMIGMTNP